MSRSSPQSSLCYNCESPFQPAQQCACLLWWCQACLEQEIDCWISWQDTSHFPSLSFQEQSLSRCQQNVLRFRRFPSRVSTCSFCKQPTICPQCSIFAYYQRCELCNDTVELPFHQYTHVCPRCVNEYRLVKYGGVPSIVNPFLSENDKDSCKLLWRCYAHLTMEELFQALEEQEEQDLHEK